MIAAGLSISAALGWFAASLSARGWVIPAVAGWHFVLAIYFVASWMLGLG